MQKLRKLFPLVGALLALAFVSCGSDSDDDSKTAGSISYATTSVEKTTADEAFTNSLTKTGDGTVSYASSKTDVAEVNTQTGLVTIKGAGETTITATVADSESYTYAVKTASYTLTVTAADTTPQKTAGSISYATATVSKTTDDEPFTNELTKTGDGTVSYASSKTDVAEVNATTGEVTIKGAGTATITAKVTDSDTYTYATKTASYTLTVTAADTTQQKSAGSISYATTTVSKTTADVAFTNELTKTGDGTVTYTSDNTAVATVNEDGEVTIKGAGTATITATVADSDTYTYATKTASYTLTVTQAVTYIGTKAPTEAKAVGDIVFSDGSATPYTSELTEEQKSKAVAVIFYAGSASDTLGAKTLGVGLVQETGLAWATGEFGCGTEFATSDTDGSGNWDVIVDAANKLTGVAADAAQMEVGTAATGFPAFNFANTYGVSVAGEESGWYLPAKEELQNLYESYSISGSAVKKALEKCTGTIDLSTGYFWSSSQYASNGTKAYNLNFSNGVWYDHVKTATNRYVCAVRAF